MPPLVPPGGEEALVELLGAPEASASTLRYAGKLAWPRWNRLEKWLLAQGLVTMRTVKRGEVVEKRFSRTSHGRRVARAFQRARRLVEQGPPQPAARRRNASKARPGKPPES